MLARVYNLEAYVIVNTLNSRSHRIQPKNYRTSSRTTSHRCNKLSNLQLWCLSATYRKTYMEFSKNPLLDP